MLERILFYFLGTIDFILLILVAGFAENAPLISVLCIIAFGILSYYLSQFNYEDF